MALRTLAPPPPTTVQRAAFWAGAYRLVHAKARAALEATGDAQGVRECCLSDFGAVRDPWEVEAASRVVGRAVEDALSGDPPSPPFGAAD
jgi:hypothetical protein